MNFSLRTTIRGLVAPEHRLSCSSRLWHTCLLELKRRSGGRRESGAFLLGKRDGDRRVITSFAFYDDLDSSCLDSGIVVFDGAGYGPLWQICRKLGREVVADVHTHGSAAQQSPDDHDNPMIATPGHIALIVPSFAQRSMHVSELGIYEYQGAHLWLDHSGAAANRFLYVGWWG